MSTGAVRVVDSAEVIRQIGASLVTQLVHGCVLGGVWMGAGVGG